MQMFTLIAVCVVAATVGIVHCEDEEETPCICGYIYWPVCGKDGKDYDNECLAKCAGTEMATEGKCPETSKRSACKCTRELEYVCGTDGNTYDNECLMECAGVPLASAGKCTDVRRRRDACNCPNQIGMPVCGRDGITYNSMCELGCAGTQFRFLGRCPATPAPETTTASGTDGDAAVCTEDYTPMCGDDGVTYGNLCNLDNADGTQFRFLGRCPATPAPETTTASGSDGEATVCTADYTPMCGDDGVTYGNLCNLENTEGVTLDYEGECKDDGDSRKRREADVAGAKCACPDQIDLPVCGKDGVTYNSMCALGCAGAEFRFLGHCPPTQAPETTTAAAEEETTTAGEEIVIDCVGDDCGDDE